MKLPLKKPKPKSNFLPINREYFAKWLKRDVAFWHRLLLDEKHVNDGRKSIGWGRKTRLRKKLIWIEGQSYHMALQSKL